MRWRQAVGAFFRRPPGTTHDPHGPRTGDEWLSTRSAPEQDNEYYRRLTEDASRARSSAGRWSLKWIVWLDPDRRGDD